MKIHFKQFGFEPAPSLWKNKYFQYVEDEVSVFIKYRGNNFLF